MHTPENLAAYVISRTPPDRLSWAHVRALSRFAPPARQEVLLSFLELFNVAPVLLPQEALKATCDFLFGSPDAVKKLKEGLVYPWLERVAHFRPGCLGAVARKWPASLALTDADFRELATRGCLAANHLCELAAGLHASAGPLAECLASLGQSRDRRDASVVVAQSSVLLAMLRMDGPQAAAFIDLWSALHPEVLLAGQDFSGTEEGSDFADLVRSRIVPDSTKMARPIRPPEELVPPTAARLVPALQLLDGFSMRVAAPFGLRRQLPPEALRWVQAVIDETVLRPVWPWLVTPLGAEAPTRTSRTGMLAGEDRDAAVLFLLSRPPPSSALLIQRLAVAVTKAWRTASCLPVGVVVGLASFVGRPGAGEELVLICLEGLLAPLPGRRAGLREQLASVLEHQRNCGGPWLLRHRLRKAVRYCSG